MNANAIALATYDLTRQKLHPTMPDALSKPPKDPKPSKKGGDDIAKIRLLPVNRKPVPFWSSAWCFYEIGVGPYHGGGTNFGGIQFVMYPDNKACGSGKYGQAVRAILSKLNSSARKGHFADLHGGATGAAILYGFRYRLGPFKAFDVDTAAGDLAWLIQETLPKFAALK